MGGVVNGQPVDETITNNAFIFKTDDDTFTGELTAASTELTAGATVNSLQQEHNSIASFAGKALNTSAAAVPNYTNNQGFTNGESLLTRVDNISAEFHNSSGHAHSGAAGDGTRVSVLNLTGLQLIGYAVEGANLTGVTGGSTVVTSQLTGETASTNNTVEGVVVNAPNNYVHIRDANGDEYLDSSGNKVYGRLTNAASVWTLTYYSNVAGAQTAYSFSGSNTINWFYQKLFNESNRPVYSDVFSVESDQLAGTIPDATASVKGKVLLSAAAQSVGTANAAGTQNSTVANADHVHQGVRSVAKSGSAALYGDVTLTGAGAATLNQVGNNIEVNVPTVVGGITQLTGNVTAGPGSGSQVSTIANSAVTNAMMANMVQATIKGRASGAGTGAPVDLTATQATVILNTFTGDSGSGGVKGLVPAPAAGDAAASKFLKADGTWATVAAGGSTSVTGSTGTPQNITAAGGIAFTGSNYFNMWFIQGSGGAVDLSANPQIAAGSIVGQRLLLRGCSNTNTVKLEDATGLLLNGECILSQGSFIELFWSGATWDEISRNML